MPMATSPGVALIGYDRSDGAAVAIRQAASLLAPRRALVVTVWDSVAAELLATDLGVGIPEVAREADQEDEARAEPKQPTGNASSSLLHRAREQRAPALVIGSHGRGGIGAAVLGSVSAALVHQADRPALVVPPPST